MTATFIPAASPNSPSSIQIASGNADFHNVRAGINYKFDWSKAPLVARY